MADELRYLTVQDFLWINFEVTGQPCEWNFAKLEQAVFYQYGYGTSTDLFSQAARFYPGFLKNAPFAQGNEETARLGLLLFMGLNGYDFNPEADANVFFGHLASGGDHARMAIAESFAEADHHDVTVERLGKSLIETHQIKAPV
jgi:prophage maintenance system killer protein